MVKKTKAGKEALKLIWRISPEHPHGVFIPASIRKVKSAQSSEVHEKGFGESSYALLNGAEVTETNIDAFPVDETPPPAKDAGLP